MKENERICGIDFLKGVLILLVFLGHIIPGEIDGTYPRYVIYFFHMPLFMAVSGFLFDPEHTEFRFLPMVKKYWKRMILPWIVAVIIYWIITYQKEVSPKNLLMSFLQPYNHLWFIPALLIYIVITSLLWLLFKNVKRRMLLIILIAIFISLTCRWNLWSTLAGNPPDPGISQLVRGDLRLQYLIFFVAGMAARRRWNHRTERGGGALRPKVAEVLRVMLAAEIMLMLVWFFVSGRPGINILYFFLNQMLLALAIYDATENRLPRSRLIEALGRYSLPVYLYHVLCKLLALKLFEAGSAAYYLTAFLSFGAGLVLLFFLRKNKVVRVLFIGA